MRAIDLRVASATLRGPAKPGLLIASVLALATSARAEPRDLVTRPLVLARGEVEARLVTEVSLARHSFARPLSYAPDVWLGVASRWTVGLIHSNDSVDRIAADASFCVRERDGACEHLYRGGGLDVRYGARAGDLAIAPRVRLLVRDVDPVKPAVTVGALVRWTRGRFLVAADPYVRAGLANTGEGNRTHVMVPVWLGVQPARRWLLTFRTGWDADAAVWRDGWHGQLALGARVAPAPQLELAVEAGFPSLFGPQNNVKSAALFVTAGYRCR